VTGVQTCALPIYKLTSNRVAVGRKLIVGKSVPTQTASSLPEEHRVVHKVRPGETLDKIATLYKTTVDAILTWNKRNDLSVLHPGDQITIFVGN